MTRYLLDANVFIEGKKRYYGFDFCPAFWDWIVARHAEGKVVSLDKVDSELQAGADELSVWAAARGPDFFLAPDATVMPALAQVSNWANTQGYTPAAVTTFLGVADYWLVAFALAHGDVVVTHEVPAATPTRIKIPNACLGLKVAFMSPFEMLRRERARFVLGPSPVAP